MSVLFDFEGRETFDCEKATHGVCLVEGEALDGNELHAKFDPEESCWHAEYTGRLAC